jgi:hypothetical protein
VKRELPVDLTPHARKEIEALLQVRGPKQAEALLTVHQRRDTGTCLCGWDKLGASFAGHQADVLREAGLLKEGH